VARAGGDEEEGVSVLTPFLLSNTQ
jgi:hypothetical protein